MTVECLGAISWDDPRVFGRIATAVLGGFFLLVSKFIKGRKHSDDTTTRGNQTTSTEITIAPEIENNPKNVFNPTVKVGLNEKEVGDLVSNALDRKVDSSAAEVMAHVTAELAKVQLAPTSRCRIQRIL